jgi:hypothetical protein
MYPTHIFIEFETHFIGSSHIFSSSVTWLLKLVTVDLSLNTRVTFSMVMIKQTIQTILCPSMDECLFCLL